MDPATQSMLLIIAGIGSQLVVVIAAIFAGLAAWDARRVGRELKSDGAARDVKLDAVAKDTAVVLGHVNSEKSISQGREATLKKENELLREMLADKIATAGLLAQAAASRGRVDTAPAGSTPDPTTVLGKIETNTAETAAGVEKLQGP
jgi:hypothetical protein